MISPIMMVASSFFGRRRSIEYKRFQGCLARSTFVSHHRHHFQPDRPKALP